MRKKKLCLAAAALAAALLTAAAAQAAFALPGSEERVVEELVRQRTDTLNRYYFGSLPASRAEEVMRDIETGSLLTDDIDSIRKYFQTDIDRLKDYEILEVEVTRDDKDMICARVSIRWTVEAIGGTESFTSQYSTICVREEKNFKLAQFF